MAKREVQEPYWIYPGERRPVIVQAKNKRHATHKVSESPEYDGFPPYVMTVEEFAKRCLSDMKASEPPKESDGNLGLYVGVKSIEGAVNQVFISPTDKMAVDHANKIGAHLDETKDSFVVFKIPMPEEGVEMEGDGAPKEPMAASFFYTADLRKAKPEAQEVKVVDGRIQTEVK